MSWPQTRHPLRYGPKPARYVSSITLNMIFWTIWLPQDYGSLRRRQWHPTPVLLPGKSHGQRSLVGCSSWGRKESDTTERLQFHFSLLCIGEGNGNPLQCSCLENPRDGGAWWAAVCGVAQSRTWLKWLSSSSSTACGIILPQPRIQPGSWQWNHWVPTTGPPENSPERLFSTPSL